MAALRRVDHKHYQQVNGNEHAQRLSQVARYIAGGRELREGQDDGKVQRKGRGQESPMIWRASRARSL